MEKPSTRARIIISTILIIAASVVFYLHARIYWDWTEDDAFITYRYARNILDGEGFVFNPGERVEGYSNFLWLLIITAGMRSGVDPVIFSKTAGLASGIIAMIISWFLAMRMSGRFRWSIFFVPLLLSVSPVLVRHSVSGLETAFFAALLAASILASAEGSGGSVFSDERRRNLRRVIFVFLLVLLSITRLEGPIFATVILLVRAFFLLRDNGRFDTRRLKGILVEAAFYAVAFGSYYAWRWNYFGSFMANTYYAKMSYGIRGCIDGTQYAIEFIRDCGGPLFIGLAAVPILVRKRQPVYWTSFSVLSLNLLIVIFSGGDWMFSYRFFAHILGVLAPVILAGAWSLYEMIPASGIRKRLLVPLSSLLAGTVLLSIFSAEWRTAQLVLPALRQHNYLSQNYEELGIWFRDNSKPGESIAISDVGAVAYYSDRRVIDMFGLVTPHIARQRGRMHYKSDSGFILAKNPDYIVLVPLNDGYGGYSFLRVPDAEISSMPGFKDNYEMIRAVPQHWNNETVIIYKKSKL